MNKVIIMGRLCYAPEIKVTNNGIEVTSNRIAVTRRFKNKEGENQSDFISIVAWKKTAIFINEYFKKGDGIVIEGSLQTHSYTADDGTNRDSVEVVVEQVYFPLSKKTTDTSNQQPTVSDVQPTATGNIKDSNIVDIAVDDDLPF